MKINFNKKIILGSLSVTTVLAVALSVGGFLQSRKALLNFGQEFMTNTVKQFVGTVEVQDENLKRQLSLLVQGLQATIIGEGGLYPDAQSPENMTLIAPDGSKREVSAPLLRLGYVPTAQSHYIVDRLKKAQGVEASVLQMLPEGLVRVITTVEGEDGKTIEGTYIPPSSPIYQQLAANKEYFGKVELFGKSYLGSYMPIRDATNKVCAALFVAGEMVTPQFRKLVNGVSLAGRGYAFIYDAKGRFILHPTMEGKNISGTPLWDAIGDADDKLVSYDFEGVRKFAYVDYFEPWGWHIAMSLTPDEMMLGADKTLFYTSAGIGALGLVLAAVTLLFMIRIFMRPLDKLSDATTRIAEGDLDARADYDGDDAIGRTIAAVNAMVDSLKKQLGFAEGVLNGIPVPCGVVGPDFKMVWTNRQLCELIGKSGPPENHVGVRSGAFFNDDENSEPLSDLAIRQRKPLSQEFKETVAGRDIDVLVTTTPFNDRDGNLLGSITFLQDLTEIRTQQRRIEHQNQKIAEAAREANAVSEQVSSASEELSAQIEQSSRGADEQRRRADEAATAMEEMNASVLEVARNAGEAAGLADDARTRAREGSGVVEEAVAVINRVYAATLELKKGMGDLGAQAEGIGRILNVISDIADQTNLLALNAAIEAARAGDAGRGFAVVADEVRKLAEKTMDATREVGQAIDSIQSSAQHNIDATGKAADEVNRSTELAQRSGEALAEIVTKIERTADQVRSIATAAEQQSAASEEINRSTEGINRIAAETADAMGQSARAVTELADMAQRLKTVISGMREG